jgi:uncharacterized protein
MIYLQIALAALIAGTLDTVAGFGGALLLIPILVIAVGSKDAVLLSALIPLGWNVVRMILLRQSVDWRAALLFAVGILPGAFLGARLLEDLDADLVRVAIGAVLVVFGGYYVLRLYFELPAVKGLKRWTFPVIGLLTGAIGSLLGAGHGPLQTWALGAADLGPRAISATNGVVGAVTAVARLIGYGSQGLLHDGLWIPGAVGIVTGGVGAMLGVRLSRRAKDSTLELIIGMALILAGIKMFF